MGKYQMGLEKMAEEALPSWKRRRMRERGKRSRWNPFTSRWERRGLRERSEDLRIV